MNPSGSNLRDFAMKQISEGVSRYNNSKEYELKKQGYDVFIQGVSNLMNSAKNESNSEIVKIVKEKIDGYLKQAQEMKNALNSIAPSQEQQKPSNNKPNYNNGAKSPRNEGSKIKEGGNSEEDKFKNNLTEAIVTEKPNVKWDDVAGLINAKKSLQEAVILPIKFPQIFTGSRKPWKGILLYGPPGTGKTFLAKACATECEGTFFSLSSSDLISKWVGESEKLIKTLFKMAREQKPSIIFIDEVDSLASTRSEGENDSTRRVKTELLVQMQGVGKEDEGVLVLGATNIPWELDPAVRRRFEKRIYIPLPDAEARIALLKNQMKKTPNSLNDDDFEYLANATEGFSGSDLSVLIRDASFQPLRKCERATRFRQVKVDGKMKFEPCAPSDPNGIEKKFMDLNGDVLKLPDVDIDDFNVVLTKCKPSVSIEDIKKQIEFTEKFGQDG